jgi:hypothetical protein
MAKWTVSFPVYGTASVDVELPNDATESELYDAALNSPQYNFFEWYADVNSRGPAKFTRSDGVKLSFDPSILTGGSLNEKIQRNLAEETQRES